LRDGIHCLTDQLVSANEDFHRIKLRMDSIFGAAEYNIRTTQEEVDKLSNLVRDIQDDHFDTGEYITLYSRLECRILDHLEKTFNCRGTDKGSLEFHFGKVKELIYHIDPSAKKVIEWTKKGKELLDGTKEERKTEKSKREANVKKGHELHKKLDTIPGRARSPSPRRPARSGELKLKPDPRKAH